MTEREYLAGNNISITNEVISANGYTYDPTNNSFAEGSNTIATNDSSHAEGDGTKAQGFASHAEGIYTIATNQAEHAEGKYNKSNTNTISSIGIGTSESDRNNAFEVMSDGSIYIKGIGGYDGTNALSSEVKSIQTIISELLSK